MLQADEKFCAACGQRVPPMSPEAPKFCGNCGSALTPAAKFCKSCGAAIEKSGGPVASMLQSPPKAKAPKLPRWARKSLEAAMLQTPVIIEIRAKSRSVYDIYVNGKSVDYEPRQYLAAEKKRAIKQMLKEQGFNVLG
ncbi:MAG: zinc-ribbon domain-containing protein [Candidatus Heimdallarchaeota archaeon]